MISGQDIWQCRYYKLTLILLQQQAVMMATSDATCCIGLKSKQPSLVYLQILWSATGTQLTGGVLKLGLVVGSFLRCTSLSN